MTPKSSDSTSVVPDHITNVSVTIAPPADHPMAVEAAVSRCVSSGSSPLISCLGACKVLVIHAAANESSVINVGRSNVTVVDVSGAIGVYGLSSPDVLPHRLARMKVMAILWAIVVTIVIVGSAGYLPIVADLGVPTVGLEGALAARRMPRIFSAVHWGLMLTTTAPICAQM